MLLPAGLASADLLSAGLFSSLCLSWPPVSWSSVFSSATTDSYQLVFIFLLGWYVITRSWSLSWSIISWSCFLGWSVLSRSWFSAELLSAGIRSSADLLSTGLLLLDYYIFQLSCSLSWSWSTRLQQSLAVDWQGRSNVFWLIIKTYNIFLTIGHKLNKIFCWVRF